MQLIKPIWTNYKLFAALTKHMVLFMGLSLLLLASSAYALVVINKTGTKIYKIKVKTGHQPRGVVCYTKQDLENNDQFTYIPGGNKYFGCGAIAEKGGYFTLYNADSRFFFCSINAKISQHSTVTLHEDKKHGKCTID